LDVPARQVRRGRPRGIRKLAQQRNEVIDRPTTNRNVPGEEILISHGATLGQAQRPPSIFWRAASSSSLGMPSPFGAPPSPKPEPAGADVSGLPAASAFSSAARFAGLPERDFFCGALPFFLPPKPAPGIGPMPGICGTPPFATVFIILAA